MYTVYILQSLIGKHFYTGVTKDLKKRLEKHNKGANKSTARFKPWKIIYSESYADKHTAYKREYYLKHPVGFIEKKSIISKHCFTSGGIA